MLSKKIINYPDYEVTYYGKIISYKHNNPKILSPSCWGGYLRLNLCKDGIRKTFPVHRLVGIHFVDNPEGKPFINHKDGVKTNNWATNLEWVTASENAQHAYDAGLVDKLIGEEHHNTKLPDNKVKEIRRRYRNEDISHAKLAEDYPISRTQVGRIIRYERRANI